MVSAICFAPPPRKDHAQKVARHHPISLKLRMTFSQPSRLLRLGRNYGDPDAANFCGANKDQERNLIEIKYFLAATSSKSIFQI
jgi:hypothetical protein